MSEDNNGVIIPSFSFGGYRSFGEVQRFDKLAKVNLLIGRNNSGKSNILRFLHSVYAGGYEHNTYKFSILDYHNGTQQEIIVGSSISLDEVEGEYLDFNRKILPKFPVNQQLTQYPGYILKLLKAKSELEKLKSAWFDFSLPKPNGNTGFHLSDVECTTLYPTLEGRVWHNMQGILNRPQTNSPGSRVLDVLNAVSPKPMVQTPVELIPAIREIGNTGAGWDGYGGQGLIDHLADFQNPANHTEYQEKSEKFIQVNTFHSEVTGYPDSRLEVPSDRKTIFVHIEGKRLPLDSLGTGIHEVIILAVAATTLDNTVICMEEPELHLNPLLQKRLVRYLAVNTTNQYFITTHSAALMDTLGAEVFHVRMENGASVVEKTTSDSQRSSVCEDLGYHPSDLLQANCVIWVEGPSERTYLNFWIASKAPGLTEGIDYSVMFYGGRLASHISGEDLEPMVENFISLRRLNRRGVIIMDSDKGSSRGSINDTKKRLEVEFNSGQGFAWVTAGREIENYFEPELLERAIKVVHVKAVLLTKLRMWDNCLRIKKTPQSNESQADKMKVASSITKISEANFNVLDLDEKITELVAFIKASSVECTPA